MKSIKYILLTTLILSAWGAIDAQQGRSIDWCKPAGAGMETFYDELGLNNDQQALLIAENDRFEKERQNLRNQNKGGSGNRNNDQMEVLREQHSINMKAIMDENQYSKYQAKRKEIRESGHKGSRCGQESRRGHGPY